MDHDEAGNPSRFQVLREMARTLRNLANDWEKEENGDRPIFFRTKARSHAAEASATLSNEELLILANKVYNSRKRRSKKISGEIFGEPAWDMMLDLYISGRNGQSLSTKSVILAGHVPKTTGLRWLQALEDKGLIERFTHNSDGRSTLVRITQKGDDLVTEYLGAISEG